MKNKLLHITILSLLTTIMPVTQAQDAPGFQNLRFTEDWSGFDASESDHWSTPLKRIEVNDTLWVSVGGEQRIRYESWNNPGFNRDNDDDYTLFRTQLHADIHVGENWRVFLEGRMTTVNNRTAGKRAALDIDEGDFGNAFVEGKFNTLGSDMTVRLGRQELQYGKQRLISPLDWANNRRLFDGGVVSIQGKSGYKLDFFVTSPVSVDPDELSLNDTNDDTLFSGIYYTRSLNDKTKLDVYALSYNERHGSGTEEDRYTIGGHYYGKYNDNLSFDTEFAYQFGEQNTTDLDIEAWMLTVEGTYSFSDVAWKPAITLGVDIATGDDDGTDGDLETFRQLFPLAHAYLGFSDVVARQNIIDFRGTVVVWPIAGKLRLRGDVHLLQLESDDDGFYSIPSAPGAPARVATDEDDLGTAIDLTTLYKFNKYSNVLVGYSHFEAGDFIDDTGNNDDIDFFYVQCGYTF